MKILNFTIHNLTPDQLKDGAVEIPDNYKEALKNILLVTKDDLTPEKLRSKAQNLYSLFLDVKGDMKLRGEEVALLVGSGSPSLQPFIVEQIVYSHHQEIRYSHTDRECVETPQQDGSVKKEYIFKHVCFYTPFPLPTAEDYTEDLF